MADFRKAVSDALDTLGEDDFILLLADLMSQEKLRYGMAKFDCPHCERAIHRRVEVLTPDYTGYTRALQALDGIGKGRPIDPSGPIEVDDAQVERAVERVLEKMMLTDAQLVHLAAD